VGTVFGQRLSGGRCFFRAQRFRDRAFRVTSHGQRQFRGPLRLAPRAAIGPALLGIDDLGGCLLVRAGDL
jgi:hypothetical protein